MLDPWSSKHLQVHLEYLYQTIHTIQTQQNKYLPISLCVSTLLLCYHGCADLHHNHRNWFIPVYLVSCICHSQGCNNFYSQFILLGSSYCCNHCLYSDATTSVVLELIFALQCPPFPLPPLCVCLVFFGVTVTTLLRLVPFLSSE